MTRRHRDAAAIPATVRKLRCAVYTRVSTDEQTSQEYNSLHAQRDASEAFVSSQRAEGWVLVHDHYNDGGISGLRWNGRRCNGCCATSRLIGSMSSWSTRSIACHAP